jgi:hypothetical protein
MEDRPRTELLAAERLGIRVQAEQDRPVSKRVLVLSPRASVYLGVRGTDYRLNLSAVDQTGDIWVRYFCSWQAATANISEDDARVMIRTQTSSPSCVQQPYQRCQRHRQGERTLPQSR